MGRLVPLSFRQFVRQYVRVRLHCVRFLRQPMNQIESVVVIHGETFQLEPKFVDEKADDAVKRQKFVTEKPEIC